MNLSNVKYIKKIKLTIFLEVVNAVKIMTDVASFLVSPNDIAFYITQVKVGKC